MKKLMLILMASMTLIILSAGEDGEGKKGKDHKKMSQEEREAKFREKMKAEGKTDAEIEEAIKNRKEHHAKMKELHEKWHDMTPEEREAARAKLEQEMRARLAERGLTEEEINQKIEEFSKRLKNAHKRAHHKGDHEKWKNMSEEERAAAIEKIRAHLKEKGLTDAEIDAKIEEMKNRHKAHHDKKDNDAE